MKTAADLERVDALALPGGESTTMSKLLTTSELFEPLSKRIDEGMPVFGTCAGMILCANEVLDGRPDQRGFERIDITVRRNGYGRQLDSFEADVAVTGRGRSLPRRVHPGAARGPRRRAASRCSRSTMVCLFCCVTEAVRWQRSIPS